MAFWPLRCWRRLRRKPSPVNILDLRCQQTGNSKVRGKESLNVDSQTQWWVEKCWIYVLCKDIGLWSPRWKWKLYRSERQPPQRGPTRSKWSKSRRTYWLTKVADYRHLVVIYVILCISKYRYLVVYQALQKVFDKSVQESYESSNLIWQPVLVYHGWGLQWVILQVWVQDVRRGCWGAAGYIRDHTVDTCLQCVGQRANIHSMFSTSWCVFLPSDQMYTRPNVHAAYAPQII